MNLPDQPSNVIGYKRDTDTGIFTVFTREDIDLSAFPCFGDFQKKNCGFPTRCYNKILCSKYRTYMDTRANTTVISSKNTHNLLRATQKEVVAHMLREKSFGITCQDGFDEGILRLAAVIHLLRDDGWIIETVDERVNTRYGRQTDIARYFLVDEGKSGEGTDDVKK